jgi:hypothetical protein
MYILINYLTFLILFSFSAASFLITGYLSDLAFFQKTSFWVLFSVIYNWGHLLICMAMLLSVFFKRSRRALSKNIFYIHSNKSVTRTEFKSRRLLTTTVYYSDCRCFSALISRLDSNLGLLHLAAMDFLSRFESDQCGFLYPSSQAI